MKSNVVIDISTPISYLAKFCAQVVSANQIAGLFNVISQGRSE